MANEEKAREIELNVYAFEEKPKGEFQAPAYRAALKMAEWKDQQFKEYLEKKKDNYMRHREMWQQDSFEWGCYNSQIDTIDEIINELFKE